MGYSTPFDEKYYESGISSGVSCYENYRWLPEKTIPVAMSYVDYLGIPRNAKVLDFGCAKGFYVKALRLLHRDAYGCDVSSYAVSHADEETSGFLSICTREDPIPFDIKFDYLIAKDVFEHLDTENIETLLKAAYDIGISKCFVVVPIARQGKYIIPSDNLDKTHIQKLSFGGWNTLLNSFGWNVEKQAKCVSGIKEHQKLFNGGIGFFTLSREV